MKFLGLRVSRIAEWWGVIRLDLPPLKAWMAMATGIGYLIFGKLPNPGIPAKRYRICVRCFLFDRRRCQGCGCYLPYKVSTARDNECPIENW